MVFLSLRRCKMMTNKSSSQIRAASNTTSENQLLFSKYNLEYNIIYIRSNGGPLSGKGAKVKVPQKKVEFPKFNVRGKVEVDQDQGQGCKKKVRSNIRNILLKKKVEATNFFKFLIHKIPVLVVLTSFVVCVLKRCQSPVYMNVQ